MAWKKHANTGAGANVEAETPMVNQIKIKDNGC